MTSAKPDHLVAKGLAIYPHEIQVKGIIRQIVYSKAVGRRKNDAVNDTVIQR